MGEDLSEVVELVILTLQSLTVRFKLIEIDLLLWILLSVAKIKLSALVRWSAAGKSAEKQGHTTS